MDEGDPRQGVADELEGDVSKRLEAGTFPSWAFPEAMPLGFSTCLAVRAQRGSRDHLVATFWVTAPPAMMVRKVALRSSVQSGLRSNLVEAQISTPSAQTAKEGLRLASWEKRWAE